jgi:hypothetical protein
MDKKFIAQISSKKPRDGPYLFFFTSDPDFLASTNLMGWCRYAGTGVPDPKKNPASAGFFL